jgi:hypothetical protein
MVPRNPTVSVALPVYNAMPYLSDALDSIAAQTYQDFEIICVDDGSDDGTDRILADYQRRENRLFVHRQSNVGVASALNRACRLARGRYIARMDADDVALANRLEEQVAFLDRHPEVAVVGGAVELVNADGLPFHLAQYPLRDADIRLALTRSNPFVHSAVLLRTSALHAVGGYRPASANAEDYDLWLRLAEHYQLANLPDPVLRYRVHRAQVTSARLRVQSLAALAVRVAAQTRRTQGCDPLSTIVGVDNMEAALTEHGVGDEDMISWLLDAHISHAYTVSRSGDADGAAAIWNDALAIAGRSSMRRRWEGSVYLARARRLREQRQTIRAAAMAARACLADAKLLGQLLPKTPGILRAVGTSARRQEPRPSRR